MLVKSFPAMKDVMHNMKRVVDVDVLAKNVRRLARKLFFDNEG
jgi:hypothetical protein